MVEWRSPRNQFILALLVSSLVSIGLYCYGALRSNSLDYGFFVWNLTLAWIPLLLSVRLTYLLKTKLWSSWEALATSVAWLIFLPNSFYMISDLIHLQSVNRAEVLYYSVTFMSFIVTAVILGYSSLYLVHLQLRKRLSAQLSMAWAAATLFICSVAIFIGRDLRWNSWDVIINPGGLLFDISERLQHLAAYPQMLITIVSFFVLLTSMYYLIWRGILMLKSGLADLTDNAR